MDGSEVTFASKDELKEAIKEYKETAGEDAVRSTMVFPVTVEYDDATTVSVASLEELQALKDD